MVTEREMVVVPEEIFTVSPDLDFDSLRVVRKPRGEGSGWIEKGVPEIRGLITLLTDAVTERIMDRLPALEIVSNCAVGTDNIDIEAATNRGIWVTNTPGVLTEATADLTWALILAVTRRIREGQEKIVKEEFGGWGLDFLLGLELSGEVLGIIGPGRIGMAVALRGKAFGMDVIYSGKRRSPEFESATGGRYVTIDSLFSIARVVSVHVPLNPETEHMVGERELELMRDDAVLINTSRGDVVDEKALIKALRKGKIFGAGLDVFEHEPRVPGELYSMPNVVVSPHIGSATRETRGRMVKMAYDNLMAVMRHGEPPNPVNRPV
jgi:glyoxylate reductase